MALVGENKAHCVEVDLLVWLSTSRSWQVVVFSLVKWVWYVIFVLKLTLRKARGYTGIPNTRVTSVVTFHWLKPVSERSSLVRYSTLPRASLFEMGSLIGLEFSQAS